MIPFDIYVLSPHRTTQSIHQFLDRFAVGMDESASDYPLPAFVDNPSFIFQKTSELLAYLIDHPTEPYMIYYHNLQPNAHVRNAIVAFTNDNHLIVGLTVYATDVIPLKHYLKTIGEAVSGEYGYWTIETPPPLSSCEFIKKTTNAEDPKLSKKREQEKTAM